MSEMPVTPEMLRQFEILEEFTDEELAEVAQLCREERYDARARLFGEGETAERLYLVLEGKISLEKKVQLGRSGSSRTATVSIEGPGKAIGWSSLVTPFTYTASGTCLQPARLLVLDGSAIHRLMARDPKAGLKLMTAIARLVRGRMEDRTSTLTYFLSIIAHELKSPLAAIENYMQVMLGGFAGQLNDRQVRMLKRSALRVKDLRGLIDGILDLARMRPEDIQSDFESFDPGEVFTEAVEDVQLAAQEAQIKVEAEVLAQFQPIVGARRRLRQVFTNLLSNAIKFSPSGSVVRLRAWDEPDRLVAQVVDEGVGIPAEDQAHIFEDFFRAQNVGEMGGSGLGLSIVKKIVDAHQGKIWFESPRAPGKPGTTFTVAIPRGLAEPGTMQTYQQSVRRNAWPTEGSLMESSRKGI
jgi:signal transduction histidine kinase